MATGWIRTNYYKIALIGIGVSAVTGILYSLLTTKPKHEPRTDKVTSQAVVKFLAKKMIPKIELKNDRISDEDLADLFIQIQADCQLKLAGLKRELSE